MKPSEWQEVSQHVEQMLESLNFGSITLVIQDGKVIQIEKNEKVRLQSNKTR
ncbi:YezD family protein [Mesobacillus maritimus]|uniref:YezD family protein n=1 Tax=Mesobacillus maritimus TaxID=1643336 RepID=UPI002559BBAE|nr:YezD family protein [Mesobacillus maritimus]